MQQKTALTQLKQRSEDDWLIGYNSQEFFELAERTLEALRSRLQPETPLTILLAERNPFTFLAHFIAACAANCRIVLANPDWVDAEWQQVFALMTPDLIWSDRSLEQWKTAETPRHRDDRTAESLFLRPTRSPFPLILIPTGGTSGNIRFAIHTWETLMASVDGFCQYFEVKQVNSFCVLPLYHVSGLMQFLRSFTTGGSLIVLPFKAVEVGERHSINPETFFLSLVPTQLQRLLNGEGRGQKAKGRRQKAEAEGDGEAERAMQCSKLNPQQSSPTPHPTIAWLARFHTVLLGGAPAWSDLLEQARQHRIRLSPTYGMTETASQIATLKPDDFLNGHTSAGKALPHAQITIRNSSGEILAPHQIGNVTIHAKSLAWGYYPSSSDNSDRVDIALHPPSMTPLFPRQNSCSGGLGELGPQGGKGEDLRTQYLNGAEALAYQDLGYRERGFQPDDLGFFDSNSYLHIVGRQNDKIITGGENVFPIEVEAAIRSTGFVQDVCVIGVTDRHWGQAITAVYVPAQPNTPTATIQAALEAKLSKFKRPKAWVAVDRLPRNAQGKINRCQVEALVSARLPTGLAID